MGAGARERGLGGSNSYCHLSEDVKILTRREGWEGSKNISESNENAPATAPAPPPDYQSLAGIVLACKQKGPFIAKS